MKKRVFSILLALALCITCCRRRMGGETGTNGDETCVHDWNGCPQMLAITTLVSARNAQHKELPCSMIMRVDIAAFVMRN